MTHPRNWFEIREAGLYCVPADTYIDPRLPVARAIITHGHSDHARAGHGHVYATVQTLGIMRIRYGDAHAETATALDYGEPVDLPGAVRLRFAPAGHILGSAQAVLDYQDGRIVISGDYKRSVDPTCRAFEPVACDVFVTEATFGLPVFQHPPIEQEIQKLLDSQQLFPDSCHIVGAYPLGKCQRVMMCLRRQGYVKPIFLHGAQVKLCEYYESQGLDLGEWYQVGEVSSKKILAGHLVLAPPSALNSAWQRGFPSVVTAMASGWMRVRARARQKRVELPLIISDHCDWPELLQTVKDVAAPEVWVTHGREAALVHQIELMGFRAQALSLLGYEDEESE